MADLIDRISGVDRPRKINLHRWLGTQRLYALSEWTRAQIASEFDITGNADEERQAIQIADKIDSFTGNNGPRDKVIYIGRLEGVFMCLEDANDHLYHNGDGTINKTKVFEDTMIAG